MPEPATAPAIHLGLAPLAEAVRRTEARVALLPVPMHWPPHRRFWPQALDPVARAFSFLLAHVRMAGRLWALRHHDLVIVREFLTPLVPLVWPLIWPLRRRVVLLLNHNIQEAEQRRPERLILRTLSRTGCRFACLETDEGCRALGLPAAGPDLLVLPHPLEVGVPPRPPRTGRPVVGVVGEMRGEKNVADLLDTLLEARDRGELDANILLGCPDPDAAATWRERGAEVVSTAALADYLAAFDRADVVALNYRRERYRWRASGVAADALSRRVPVVCPDFPVMRHQLGSPVAVGAVFDSEKNLVPAIHRALALAEELDAVLDAHATHRGVAALASALDRFVSKRRRS
jgi:glycosyltransferase involved in cell wall biosynthesis